MSRFYTVGHSTRTLPEFIELLRSAPVTTVVDVRRIPGSRRYPDYGIDRLPGSLHASGLEYRYVAGLGGRRGRARDVPPEVNALWQNQSFHNYADYALSDEFAEGFADLLETATRGSCAIMCAEAVWWRCHRRIIADRLLALGHEVFHLMSPGRVEAARLTPGAVVSGDRVLYPAA